MRRPEPDDATRLPDGRRDRRRPRRRRAAGRAHGVCGRRAALLSATSDATRFASSCSRPVRAFCPRSTRSWRPWQRGVLQRRGADIRVSTPVRSIETGRVSVANETIDAGTIVLAAGIVPSAIASGNSRRARSAWPDRRRWDDAEPQPSAECLGAGRLRGNPGTGRPPLSGARAAYRPRGATSRAQHPGGDRQGVSRRRSSSNRSEPWPRSGTRAPSRACSAFG